MWSRQLMGDCMGPQKVWVLTVHVTPPRRSESPKRPCRSQSPSVITTCMWLSWRDIQMRVKYTEVSKQGSETPEEECACFWRDRCPLLPFGLLPLLKIPGMVSWHMRRTYSASWLVQGCRKVILRCVALHTVQDPNFNFHRTACEVKVKNLLRCLAGSSLIL